MNFTIWSKHVKTAKFKHVKIAKFISFFFELFFIKPIAKHNEKRNVYNFCSLALHIYNNFDLCLDIYFCFICKVW